MKVADLLEQRRQNWRELEDLNQKVASQRVSKLTPTQCVRFSALYRSVCADLALAESYHLPQATVQYLHRLTATAHHNLYIRKLFDPDRWMNVLIYETPRNVFRDRCVQTAFLVFWGFFILSAYASYDRTRFPEFATEVLGETQITQLENSFKEPIGSTNSPRRTASDNALMFGFYIMNNAGIGLQCFSTGLLVIPGIYVLFSNAVTLGASFGYMARPDVQSGANFFNFVTAHGPFELTAVTLSAGAGLRIGLSWIYTRGLSRMASIQVATQRAFPVAMCATAMFIFAAVIEGFVSPSQAPYWMKAGVAVISSTLIVFYFVFLGVLVDFNTPEVPENDS